MSMQNKEFTNTIGNTQEPADLRDVPPDVASAEAARIAQSLAPIGSPNVEAGVRSVYDSRPINGGDFNVYSSTSTPQCGGTTYIPAGFTVPQGYVAILKLTDAWMEPPKVLTNRSQVTVSLQVNGGLVNQNVDIAMGNDTGDRPVSSFVIADEGQVVTARIIDVGNTWGAAGKANIRLYGNLLLKTGRPANLEVANIVGQNLHDSGTDSGVK